MLEKLAIWYLERINKSIILNCKFDKRLTIRVKNSVYHNHNHYITGTDFLFENGNRMILADSKELEE